MLKVTIPAIEYYDEDKEEFLSSKEVVLLLEHSLVSLSKWESKWCKPFLSKDDKTVQETRDYIACMTITQNVDPSVYNRLTSENIQKVEEYIEAPMTATSIKNNKRGLNRETITSEIIYYSMIALNIPFECQKWHLNRLITLINVCNIKSNPPKKMGRRELLNRNAALNSARRKELGTRG